MNSDFPVYDPHWDHEEARSSSREEHKVCPICEASNGHHLSCATFRFNHIEGSAIPGTGPSFSLVLASHDPNAPLACDREMVDDAIDDTLDQTGISLNPEQMISLLKRSGIDGVIARLGEVETEVRSRIANFLSIELLGRSWPINNDSEDRVQFFERLHEKAIEAGYIVRD